jgi:hypothetical protein
MQHAVDLGAALGIDAAIVLYTRARALRLD